MLVTRKNAQAVCDSFCQPGIYALDTETTGLYPHKGHRLFSIILSNAADNFYFNFLDYPYLDSDLCLDRAEVFPMLQKVLDNEGTLWFMVNAKFDMSMLKADGLEVKGEVHDCVVAGRIIDNNDFKYGLDHQAKKYLDMEKDDAVEKHIKEHKLYDTVISLGKKEKVPRYDRVPFDIISNYGQVDGEITMKLGVDQLGRIHELDKKIPSHLNRNPTSVFENEKKLTKVLFDMEWLGIKANRTYCQAAYDSEMGRYEFASSEFQRLTGKPLVDSGKALAVAFGEAGYDYPKTDKGNPCFNSEVLKGLDCDLAKYVLAYRSAEKRLGTYYANFLTMADKNNVIHCSMRQSGTLTGRMSCAYPNLQNVPKSDAASEFPIRRAFIPRDDFCFVMIDYDQMEYRLMLDYANEKRVIRKILDEGLDVHTATSQMVRIDRTFAKTVNFMILYGGGIKKMADTLEISVEAARNLKYKYFDELRRVEQWTRDVIRVAKQRGWIHNWAGRICRFDAGFEFKAPNHLIQGGCADIVKYAMIDLAEFLKPLKSKMLLQIHDEVLFEIHKNELEIVENLKTIMEKAYPHKHLPLTCGVDHSWESWHDKVKGLPC